MELGIFPSQYIKKPVETAGAVRKLFEIDNYNDLTRWVGHVPKDTGLIRNTQTQDTYTLYTSTHDTIARLLDHNGEVIHNWTLKFNEAWTDTSHIISLFKLTDFYFYLRDFHLYDNGDIVLMVSAAGITPWGAGLVKLDKYSNVLWTYSGYVNNDFDVGTDGTLYTIEHRLRETGFKAVPDQPLPFLEDNIVLLNKSGEKIKMISLIDALENSSYSTVLERINDNICTDPTHSNSIKYIKETNPSIPWMKEGYLLISVRNLNTMVVLDPHSEEIVYAMGLPSRMQHDIDLTSQGTLMLFDNQGDTAGEEHTRIIEFDPETQKILWTWDKDAQGDELLSNFWGAQERYENGHTFILNPEKGQFFELDNNNNVIWAYTTPLYRIIKEEARIPSITSAKRFPSSQLNF